MEQYPSSNEVQDFLDCHANGTIKQGEKCGLPIIVFCLNPNSSFLTMKCNLCRNNCSYCYWISTKLILEKNPEKKSPVLLFTMKKFKPGFEPGTFQSLVPHSAPRPTVLWWEKERLDLPHFWIRFLEPMSKKILDIFLEDIGPRKTLNIIQYLLLWPGCNPINFRF